jgi:glycine cleavage system regulatory protein
MSHADHEWAKEQIAAHLAGGLSADERARLEAHMASCAECIAEVDAARRFDRQMDDLFAPIRPKTGLEERIIRQIRLQPAPQLRSTASRYVLAAAAVVLMGVLGFVIIQVDQGNVDVVEGLVSSQRASNERMPAPVVKAAPMSPSTGATFSLDEPALTLESADKLARLQAHKHNELADDESDRTKGDSARFGGRRELQDSVRKNAPAPGRMAAAPTAPPPPAAEPPPADPASVLAIEPAKDGKERLYRYRDDGPAENKKAEANAFKPGDAFGAKAPQAKNEMAKADERAAGKGGGAGVAGQLRGSEALKELGEQAQGQQKLQTGQGEQEPQPKVQRKIIRTGEVEYEVESFDSSLATITKLVEEEQGFVGTVNSDKLANGKVRGTVVLRCPPERLDTLLLKLRGLGELKSQNIRSQDVSKQYYDLESRLKAARAMETRLLDIIAKGKGEIKDLLLAEKELGEWRTKIETYEGEKRYYDSQVGLSTLTVTLMEKEIRAPFAVTQTEKVNMGLEVEDVEKAHKDALAAVSESKGRVTKSELKQLAAGQFNATLYFEVAPDASGALRDRFKQLGNVARLDIDRVQETQGGTGKAAEVLKVIQKDTQFFVSIYNLANVSPRETVVINLACADAEASYKTILARIEKAGGRVVTSSLNRQKNDQTTGQLRFEIKAAEAEAVLNDVRLAGEVMRLDVNENPDTQNVTKSKRGFQVQLFAMGLVDPRETTTISIASKDVPAAYQALQDALQGAQARILTAQLNENDRQNVNATLWFDVRKENYGKIDAALAAAGEVLNRSSTRAQEVERVVDSKKRIQLTLINVASIQPREAYTIAVVVDQVETAVTTIEALAAELKGRVVDSQHQRTADGQHVSMILVDLPLTSTRGAADRIKNLGHMRVFNVSRNPQAPEGALAIGRIQVTVSNPDKLVSNESGPWNRIKSGLSVGLTALSWSLTLVVVGLCFVVPIGGMLWLGRKLFRKSKETTAPAA